MSNHIKSIVPFIADREEFMDAMETTPVVSQFNGLDFNLDKLLVQMKAYPSTDPVASNRKTIGFKVDDETPAVFDSQMLHIKIECREKLVPNDVINRAVEKRVKLIVDNTGNVPDRKERNVIKDEVSAELLSKALIRSRTYTMTFMQSEEDNLFYIMVANATTKLAEDIASFVCLSLFGDRRVLTHFFMIGDNIVNAEEAMMKIFCQLNEHGCEGFEAGSAIKFKDPDRGVMSVKDYDTSLLDIAYSQMAVNGCPITAIELMSSVSGSELYFMMDNKLRFSKLSMSLDDVGDKYGVEDFDGGVELFLAEAFVYCSEVAMIIKRLKNITA